VFSPPTRSLLTVNIVGFLNARTWLEDIRAHADPHLTCVLIGTRRHLCTSFRSLTRVLSKTETSAANKIDLCGNCGDESNSRRRQVTFEEAELWAKQEGLLFLEASAKTGDNVDEASRQFRPHIISARSPNLEYRRLTRQLGTYSRRFGKGYLTTKP
jgi:Ras family